MNSFLFHFKWGFYGLAFGLSMMVLSLMIGMFVIFGSEIGRFIYACWCIFVYVADKWISKLK